MGALSFEGPWAAAAAGSAVKLQLGLTRDVGELAALLELEAGEDGGLDVSREKNLPLINGELAGLEKEPKVIKLPRLLC